MATPRSRARGIAGAFAGVGAAMSALALSGNKPTGQRVLYLIAGVMFIFAAGMRLWKARHDDRP